VAAQSADAQQQSCAYLIEELATDGSATLDGVAFDFNRATMLPESLPALVAARDAILTAGGDWQLAGHTDDRGSRIHNQALSEQRAMAVRDWLVGAGVPAERLTAAGFGFDQPIADNATAEGRALNRRVSLMGAVAPESLDADALTDTESCPATLTAGTRIDVPPPPPINGWIGDGGLDWLPFSYLVPADGGVGLEGQSMPAGTLPQGCQLLCAADTDCAAFSFEPAGSDLIENAQCTLVGYGTKVDLRRDHGYAPSGAYFAAGLKPDAQSLTPESAEIAQRLLADLADIAVLRRTIAVDAPDTHAPDAFMAFAIDSAVPPSAFLSYLEIAELGDYALRDPKSSVPAIEMEDSRSGRILVPGPGDYVLRYVVDHPTANRQVIFEQPLHVPAATFDAPREDGGASLSFPMVVAPGEVVPVIYSGPLHDGDWIDIVAVGNESDMSGGLGWDWATREPVRLSAPAEEGEYMLRYVAEDPSTGRRVLASETLVVRAPAIPAAAPNVLRRCEAAGLTPCDIVLPEHDVSLTLLPGYGISEPSKYVTPGGAAATRPTFEVLRLGDGKPVVRVNAHQANAVYCQDGLAGDTMCVTDAVTDDDSIAVAFVLASVGPAAMATEMYALGAEEPGAAPGDLQGVWFADLDDPGNPGHGTPFIMVELFQDAGDDEVFGYFVAAPDAGLLPGVSGDITGRLDDGALTLTLARGDGTALATFAGSSGGDISFDGELTSTESGSDPIATRLSRVAGPGEDWAGPPWMTNAGDGSSAAVRAGQVGMPHTANDLPAEDRAIAEIMGTLIGTVTGSVIDPASYGTTASVTLAPLDPKTVDLKGLPSDAIIDLIVPYQDVGR
jgi:hypothetical protein